MWTDHHRPDHVTSPPACCQHPSNRPGHVNQAGNQRPTRDALSPARLSARPRFKSPFKAKPSELKTKRVRVLRGYLAAAAKAQALSKSRLDERGAKLELSDATLDRLVGMFDSTHLHPTPLCQLTAGSQHGQHSADDVCSDCSDTTTNATATPTAPTGTTAATTSGSSRGCGGGDHPLTHHHFVRRNAHPRARNAVHTHAHELGRKPAGACAKEDGTVYPGQ